VSAEPLPIALRAYALPSRNEGTSRRSAHPGRRRSDLMLVIDCETTIDRTQALTFGCARLWKRKGGEWRPRREWLVYADDLPTEQLNVIRACVKGRRTAGRRIEVYSRREFVRRVFFPLAYRARALVVGFNLPFDLSRLAFKAGESRGGFTAGGFSLALADWQDPTGNLREDAFWPRIAVKTIDSKRHRTEVKRPARTNPFDSIEVDGEGPSKAFRFRGNFLDLRTLTFALTNQSHSLESACHAYEIAYRKRKVVHGQITPDYIEYCREDVQATFELAVKTLADFDRHPISAEHRSIGVDAQSTVGSLEPNNTYSPATLGKAYLRLMGVQPILQRQPEFAPELLGHAMTAFYGGRAECHIRRVAVPVVYLDFLAMYPTVNCLLGNWKLLIAQTIETIDSTTEVQALLDTVTLDGCFMPETWSQFQSLVWIKPQGNVLPVRAAYGDGQSLEIGVNPLTCDGLVCYTLPDLVASKLLTGRPPKVERAIAFKPIGILGGLQPVALRAEVVVDPVTQDFFQAVIEARRRVALRTNLSPAERERLDGFLKVLANASSYGIFAQVDRHELGAGQLEEVLVHGPGQPFSCKVSAPETPGKYCFPPLAALITASARLMLAMLERCVNDIGGTYAMCDTDSMAVVSTEQGGDVPYVGAAHVQHDEQEVLRALSWAEVEVIRQRFAALNPYDPAAVPGSILELEEENVDPNTGERRQLWCFAISAKRYALFNVVDAGEDVLRRCSEHGLGHLMDPTDPLADSDSGLQDAEEELAVESPLDRHIRPWIRQAWRYVLDRDVFGREAQRPVWASRPAVSRVSASTPTMLRPFRHLNQGRPYSNQVKPFNFLLAIHLRPLGLPKGVQAERFQLVSPFELDARRWLRRPWYTLYPCRRRREDGSEEALPAGSLFRASTRQVSEQVDDNSAIARTYGDVLDEYRHHPEAKFVGRDGSVCGPRTVGHLHRRAVFTSRDHVRLIGKESNRLEDVQSGLIHDHAQVITEYSDPVNGVWLSTVLPVLRMLPSAHAARESGLSVRSVNRAKAGGIPAARNRELLTGATSRLARHRLTARNGNAPQDMLRACRMYLDSPNSIARCAVCGTELNADPRRVYCSVTCRKRAKRQKLGHGLGRPGRQVDRG
jgi:hypothetical protein